jgi:hypothetical protein
VPTPALPPHLWGKGGGLKDFVERGNQLNQTIGDSARIMGFIWFYMLYGCCMVSYVVLGFMFFWFYISNNWKPLGTSQKT